MRWRIPTTLLLVIEKDIWALYVPVQKILLMAVVKPFKKLPHEGFDVILIEVHQAGLQKPHKVMVHVLKH